MILLIPTPLSNMETKKGASEVENLGLKYSSAEGVTLEQLCCCTQTYARFSDQINPWPQQSESLTALQDLCECILDPIIDPIFRR